MFVCGAGVSRTAGLPLFRGLVEKVYERLGRIGAFTLPSGNVKPGAACYGQLSIRAMLASSPIWRA